MALRVLPSARAARLLCCCPTALRHRLRHELARALPARHAPASNTVQPGGCETGEVLLPSGFRVRYRLDRRAGQVELLDLSGSRA